MAQKLPLARRGGLAAEKVQDELLVYDLDRDRAFCLNQTAAFVWKHCDGRTPPAAIAKRLKQDLGAPVDEKVVWYALDQLGRDRLLEERVALPASLDGMTRRQHLRALGKVAAVAVPLVSALSMAPRASGGSGPCNVGFICTVDSQCSGGGPLGTCSCRCLNTGRNINTGDCTHGACGGATT